MVVHLSAIGPVAIVLIAVAALLIFGPKKLPELGRSVGVTLREFKKGTKGLIDDEDEEDTKKVVIDQKSTQIEHTIQPNNKEDNVK